MYMYMYARKCKYDKHRGHAISTGMYHVMANIFFRESKLKPTYCRSRCLPEATMEKSDSTW